MHSFVNSEESHHSSKRKSSWSATVLIIFVLLAVSTRTLPLAISSLPYNNDGITEARIASDILNAGTINYPDDGHYTETHSVITPAYDVLLAFSSALLDVSPFQISQYTVAVISALTIVGIYLVCLIISRNEKGAILGAMVLSLSGTFIFLTASTWKASIGVALLVLLIYVHMNRSDRKMLVLEGLLLLSLMVVHHTVAAVAYLAVAYSTGISIAASVRARRILSGNMSDIVLISSTSICAFIYYSVTNLDRLTSLVSGEGLLLLAAVFFSLLVAGIFVAGRTRHSRFSYSPVPVILIAVFVTWEYCDPFFPYVGDFPVYVLVLGIISALFLGIAWYGIEYVMKTKTAYRFIPLIWLLPVATILLYAIVSGATLSSFQVIYRSFDFGYLAVALGVSCAVAAVARKRRTEAALIGVVIVLVLVTFPFGYMTNELEGIRHDTQEYEVDALAWVDSNGDEDTIIMSDERISYIGLALYDFVKRPHLTEYLTNLTPRDKHTFNLYLEEWAEVGVNHYPFGHVVVDEQTVAEILWASNVMYVGGPDSNSLLTFRYSELGHRAIESYL